MAQTLKNPNAVQDIQVQPLGLEDPLEKEKATHSSILAWRIPWTEEAGGLQSLGSQRVRHNWVTKHISKISFKCIIYYVGEPFWYADICRTYRHLNIAFLWYEDVLDMDSLKLLIFLTSRNLRYLTWDICPMKFKKKKKNTSQIRKLLKIHGYVSKSGKHVFRDKVSWTRNIMKDRFLDQVILKTVSPFHMPLRIWMESRSDPWGAERFSILFSLFSRVFRQILFFWKISFPANFAARSGLPGLQETVWMLQIKQSQFPDRVCGYKKCLWDKHSWLFHSLLPVGNGRPRAVWRAGCVQGMSWVLISGWHL